LKKYWSREKEEISDSVEFDVQSYLDLWLPNLLISGLKISLNEIRFH
jgi:hypothetical protein